MCPACGFGHLFDKRWTFNGNQDKPTFTPSMLTNASFTEEERKKYNLFRCHSYVTDGRIRFLDDCTHEMRGKTVDLEDF